MICSNMMWARRIRSTGDMWCLHLGIFETVQPTPFLIKECQPTPFLIKECQPTPFLITECQPTHCFMEKGGGLILLYEKAGGLTLLYEKTRRVAPCPPSHLHHNTYSPLKYPNPTPDPNPNSTVSNITCLPCFVCAAPKSYPWPSLFVSTWLWCPMLTGTCVGTRSYIDNSLLSSLTPGRGVNCHIDKIDMDPQEIRVTGESSCSPFAGLP